MLAGHERYDIQHNVHTDWAGVRHSERDARVLFDGPYPHGFRLRPAVTEYALCFRCFGEDKRLSNLHRRVELYDGQRPQVDAERTLVGRPPKGQR